MRADLGDHERRGTMSERKTLGIIGGLGPMASVCFCELLVSHTKAELDQDHINFLLSSRADIPDRTAFIVGRSSDDPRPALITEANRLCGMGADVLAIPCNTSHCFFSELSLEIPVKLLNMPNETALFCKSQGYKKLGVLATEGTVRAGIYKREMESLGIEYMTCSEEDQKFISDTIYAALKQGKAPDRERFLKIADSLISEGCDAVILGCTELSCMKRELNSDIIFIDPMEILAASAIVECGAEPTGFDAALLNFLKMKGR